MTEVFKFEGYGVYSISTIACFPEELALRYQKEPWGYLRNLNQYNSHYRDIITPVPKSIEITSKGKYSGVVNLNKFYESKTGTLADDSILYIHPNCGIPRDRVAEKYKKVLRPTNADVCIIPENGMKEDCEKVILFINNAQSIIYIIEPSYFHVNGKYDVNLPEITPIKDATPVTLGLFQHDPKESVEWTQFLDSTLLYYGFVIKLPKTKTWIHAVLENKIHHLVTERELLASLGTEDNRLTPEVEKGVMELLDSNSAEAVSLGMKTLANLDYCTYKNSVRRILISTLPRWKGKASKYGSSVKHMLEFFDYRNSWMYSTFGKTCTQEDFDNIRDSLVEELKGRIDDYITNFTKMYRFVNPIIDISINLTPILPGEEDALDSDTEDSVYEVIYKCPVL